MKLKTEVVNGCQTNQNALRQRQAQRQRQAVNDNGSESSTI